MTGKGDYAAKLKAVLDDEEFREGIVDVLERICRADTSPSPDIARTAEKENECFAPIKEFLGRLSLNNARMIEHAISPAIAEHPAYTQPYYTVDEKSGTALPADEVYRGRRNLLYLVDGEPRTPGRSTAANAHIDVVAPFYPPKREKDYLYGRGACDDKGNVAVLLAALGAIDRLVSNSDVSLRNRITAMFVIEEETGGNGSLSIALSDELGERYDSILVLEACGKNVYLGNRGAVWFKCELSRDGKAGGKPGASELLERMSFAVLEMSSEGAKIKAESEHPLFPHRPVQTCNGILGPFGEHPSRINGRIAFRLEASGGEDLRGIKDAVDEGIRKYVEKHGDKTAAVDAETGRPKVERHYDMSGSGGGVSITVHGSTGHMGSILENDDAILKWAHVAAELVKFRLETGTEMRMTLEGQDSGDKLVLEGGQGFLPPHTIDSIQERLKKACERGVRRYEEYAESSPPAGVRVSYDKLHNAAFGGDPSSETVRTALGAAVEAGIRAEDEPLRGWDVSCDARLFATELGIPVITAGAGGLKAAHSDNEYIHIPDIFETALFTALFLLGETGSV